MNMENNNYYELTEEEVNLIEEKTGLQLGKKVIFLTKEYLKVDILTSIDMVGRDYPDTVREEVLKKADDLAEELCNGGNRTIDEGFDTIFDEVMCQVDKIYQKINGKN